MRQSNAADRGSRTDALSDASAARAVQPGDGIGRYTVRSAVGASGRGRVFAAFVPELGRPVALKLIRPDRLGEAQAPARLHHPNVASVHDAGTQGGQAGHPPPREERPVDRGAARWLLARALWSLGRRDAAIASARLAEQELGAGADGAPDRAAARAWLASRR